MESERHRRLSDIFLQVCDLSPQERGEALDGLCGEDHELRARVEAMLSRDDETMLRTGDETPLKDIISEWRSIRVPESLGGYAIEEELGRGGMGVVYRARQAHPERVVALKVMRPGLATESMLKRFEFEVAALARLKHPSIAQIYEAGTADSGFGPQPFFAMEFVEGERLGDYIEQRQPSPQEILRLMSAISDAVHHAHLGGVIHRDLKPSNVMVTDSGWPKVLDFGVARAIDVDMPDSTQETQVGQLVGTVPYMSPEQAAGDPRDIDVRSDVYSLAVMAYQALSGEFPYSLEGKLIHESLRVVREVEARPIGTIRPALKGDVEIILQKALSKEKARRYASAEAFRRDIEHYLHNEPIEARPPTAVYQLSKFASRHRTLVYGVVGILLSLIAGLIVSWLLYIDVREERDKTLTLSDGRRLSELRQDAEALWPRRPEKIAAMEAWLSRAEAIRGRIAIHERNLAQLTSRAEPGESYEATWLRDAVSAIVQQLTLFSGPEGMIGEVKGRRQLATDIRKRTLQDYQASWDACIESIASSNMYGGLEIVPQVGLVPLEPDPESGLWEFWLWESGEKPIRDEHSGRYRLEKDTGLILVLIPGGSFQMGAEEAPKNEDALEDEEASKEEPEFKIADIEGPIHTVDLDPFFLSKFEWTQGQWTGLMGKNASKYDGGDPSKVDPRLAATHPVEQVTWTLAFDACRRYGLVLPTEAQWEYACRATTLTPWSCGSSLAHLNGYANIADEASKAQWQSGWDFEVSFDDGFVAHAPVGSFKPNGFGLHDMHGNVWEWCRDRFAPYTRPVRKGDGLRDALSGAKGDRIVRGGSYYATADRARSSFRFEFSADTIAFMFGLRPARALDVPGESP